MPRRVPSDRADLVIYKDDERKETFAVVECRRDGITQAEFLQAMEQACGNCASQRASYACAVAGIARRFLDFRKHPSLEREKNIFGDLPKNYTNAPEYRFYKGVPGKDLYAVSRDQLRTTIRKCHQTLWEGGRRSPIVAFGEFSKIIFIKIRDEENTDEGQPYDFQRRTSESSNEELAARIHKLYKAEQAREPDVFPEKINVDASSCSSAEGAAARCEEIIAALSLPGRRRRAGSEERSGGDSYTWAEESTRAGSRRVDTSFRLSQKRKTVLMVVGFTPTSGPLLTSK